MNHRSLSACILGSFCLAAITGCAHRGNQPWSTSQSQSQPQMAVNDGSNGGPRQVSREEFDRAKDLPINADTHFAAGQLAEAQEAPTRAIDQYEQALKLNPNHADSLYRLAVIRTKLNQFTEAIALWNRFIKATGGDPTGYANLGFCLEIAGRSGEAETAYRKGIKRDPTNAPCRVNYGLMLARHNRFNEATLEMQTVLSEAEVHYNLASVYESIGRKEQAKLEYKKALDLNPEMKEAQAKLDSME